MLLSNFRHNKIDQQLHKLVLYCRMFPRELVRWFIYPDMMVGESYYPEKTRLKRGEIRWSQLKNILHYGYHDKYFNLYGLDTKTKEERAEYVHYEEFKCLREKLNGENQFGGREILRNKLFFGMATQTLGISSPENIVYVDLPSAFMLKEKLSVSLSQMVERLGDCELFCKPMDGECGLGIFTLAIREGKLFINNQPADITALEKHIKEGGGKSLFQTIIKQHGEMSRLHPQSVNTIRLVTVRNPHTGEIDVLPSLLRIGTGDSKVDNTSQGGVAIGIDLETGRLHNVGLRKPQFGKLVSVHPDSGVKFSEFTIPYIQEAISEAKRFHSFLGLHSIGWDIAIGENGPVFIEGNDNWEINGPQSTNYGFRKIIDKYFY